MSFIKRFAQGCMNHRDGHLPSTLLTFHKTEVTTKQPEQMIWSSRTKTTFTILCNYVPSPTAIDPFEDTKSKQIFGCVFLK